VAKKNYPSEAQDRFIVRLPDGMRDRIAEAARQNGRSMNAEIVNTLMGYYPPAPSTRELIQQIEMFLGWAKRAPTASNMSSLYHSLENFREKLLLQNEADLKSKQ
jgi:hypothetical protein